MTITEHPSAMSADGALVRAYLAGDDTAFTTLYDDYYPRLVRHLDRKVRDEAIAQDLAQDAFERALRYLGTYDLAMPFWPWLKKIATNLLPAEQHRRAVERPVDEADRATLTLPDTTEDIVTIQAVWECLRMLPSRQQRALVWRYVEDRETADIAELLGIKRNAVEQLMLRARQGFGKEYRARNSASFTPGFAGLLARFRRLVGAVVSRLGGASTTTISMAGDWAVAGVVAVGGIGVGMGMVPGLHHGANAAAEAMTPRAVFPVSADVPAAQRPGTIPVGAARGANTVSYASAITAADGTAVSAAGDQAGSGAGATEPAPPQTAQPPVQTTEVPPPPAAPQPQMYRPNPIEGTAGATVETTPKDNDGDGKGQQTDVTLSAPGLIEDKTLVEFESETVMIPDADVPLL